MAAAVPSSAAVIACLAESSWTSLAADIPGIFVFITSSVIM